MKTRRLLTGLLALCLLCCLSLAAAEAPVSLDELMTEIDKAGGALTVGQVSFRISKDKQSIYIDRPEITGSADSSIRSPEPNDLPALMKKCPIERILLNGKTAERIYLKHWNTLPVEHIALPSTSPANAACSLERLTAEWGRALKMD